MLHAVCSLLFERVDSYQTAHQSKVHFTKQNMMVLYSYLRCVYFLRENPRLHAGPTWRTFFLLIFQNYYTCKLS